MTTKSLRGRDNAPSFFGPEGEQMSSNPAPRLRKVAHRRRTSKANRHSGIVDGVINGERVSLVLPSKETERGLMVRIRAALACVPGVLVWRNNVGVDSEHGIRYGLGVGSADLIGLVVVEGRAVFAGWEVKRPGQRPSEVQRRWIDLIRRHGGIAGVVTSPDEAVALVTEARRER